jgi:2-iminobutanoate/2-iminopropanoate deaminase
MWSHPTFQLPQPSRRNFLLGAAGAGILLPTNLLQGTAHASAPAWLVSEDPAFSPGATAGDLTFVAQDASGPGPVPSGAAAQTARTLENLKRALAAVGQGPDNLVFLHVMLTNYDDAPAVAKLVQAAFKPERAPTTAFIGVSKLEPNNLLVRIDAIASTNPDRQQIVAKDVPLPLGAPVHAVRVGDLVFVGAVDGPEVKGKADSGEAGSAQNLLILDRIDSVLKAGGMSLKDAFRHWQYLRNMSDAAVREAFTRGRSNRMDPILKPDEYPANSRIGSRALGAGVAQRSYVVATRGERKYVNSKFARKTPRVFSQAVRSGDWLFIAGQDAVDVSNQTLFVGDLRSQTEQCIRQLQFVMQEAGGTLDNIVKTTTFLLEGTDRKLFLDAYSKEFQRQLKSPWMPAGLTMDVDALRPDCLVEIDAVAWMGKR